MTLYGGILKSFTNKEYQVNLKQPYLIYQEQMEYVSGEILTKNGFQKGYLGFEKRKIIKKGTTNPSKKPIAKGLIIPKFINSHTHIGDSFIKDKQKKLPRDINKLVAPPNGLKHKFLKEATDEQIITGMEKSIDFMIKSGIDCFCDFRENGIKGICQLKSALEYRNISPFILSRPDTMNYDKNEIDLLLKNSDGIALSSISDWDYSQIEKIAKDVKNRNKIFALHASERIRENIDHILNLKPDFLVHMVKASKSDLTRVKDSGIPIVLCPRSNSFFGLKTDFNMFKKSGVTLLLGTDNCMLNNPNILDEIRYIKQNTNAFSDEELLDMVTYLPRKALNLDCDILGPNLPADFIVLEKKTLEPAYISVLR